MITEKGIHNIEYDDVDHDHCGFKCDGCAFHEFDPNRERPCKCTCEDLKGVIQCTRKCKYRKEIKIKVPDDLL